MRIEFDIEKDFTLIQSDIAKIGTILDISDFSLSHTHWAVKDIDLISALIKNKVLDEQDIKQQGPDSRLVKYGLTKPVSSVHIQPTVFRIPSGKVESDLVSVMMPFDSDFKGVFTALKNACSEHSLRCIRADDIWNEAEVIQDVFSLLYRSRIVICDFSGRNPNVFYEAGIAHTLGKTVIPIVQNKNDVPFDLGHIRYVQYHDNSEGLAKLQKEIAKKLDALVIPKPS